MSKLKSFLDTLHQKMFATGIGERTRTFATGFSWSMAAAFLSRIIAGLTTMAAARWLGPSEFGEANLSLASTLWIQIPLFIGLPTAIVHYLSKAPSEERQKWLAEGIGLMSLFFLLTLGLGYFFRFTWAQMLGVREPFFRLALVWCASFWFFTLFKSLLNALENFAFRARAEILYAILFPLTLFLCVRHGFQSAAYVLGLAIPYGLVGVVGLILLRPSLRGFLSLGDRSWKLLRYGILCTAGSVAAALFESPARLIANKVLDISEVGILSAYQGGSTQMAVFLLGAASQVFFPIASRTPDKQALFKKLNNALWPSAPVLIFVFATGLFLYIKILGKNYPLHPAECLIFSLAAAATLINGMLVWFVASYGWRGIVVNAVIGVGSGVVNWIGCRWAIPRFHIKGAGGAYFLASAIGIAALYVPHVRRWLNQEEG